MTDFEQIYHSYFHDVYRYLLRLSRDEHVAEELTSDTFFKAMHAIHSFRGECDIRVWLCQIAKNAYLSYVKKRSKTRSIEDLPWQDGAEPDVAEEYAQKETAARIQKILHGMKDPYKEVFLWRVYAELSFRQIAEIYGKTENWACVTYHRARKMIKEELEE